MRKITNPIVIGIVRCCKPITLLVTTCGSADYTVCIIKKASLWNPNLEYSIEFIWQELYLSDEFNRIWLIWISKTSLFYDTHCTYTGCIKKNANANNSRHQLSVEFEYPRQSWALFGDGYCLRFFWDTLYKSFSSMHKIPFNCIYAPWVQCSTQCSRHSNYYNRWISKGGHFLGHPVQGIPKKVTLQVSYRPRLDVAFWSRRMQLRQQIMKVNEVYLKWNENVDIIVKEASKRILRSF